MSLKSSLIIEKKIRIPNIMLLVVNGSGLPVFQYPITSYLRLKDNEVDDTLFSGLIHAIVSFAKDIVGEEINNMTFGESFLTIMKGKDDLIFAYIFKKIPKNSESLKQFHLETMTLFYQKIANLTLVNNPIDGTNDFLFQGQESVINQVNSIMYPLFKFWEKKIYL